MNGIVNKWGEGVAARGFTQLPNYLLLLNQFLNEERQLSPTEILVLYQLVGAWWKKDTMPFPSMTTLSVRCGVSSRQIQRAVKKLEKVNLIRRVKRRDRGIVVSNAYDLTPLVETLGKVAEAFPNEHARKIKRRLDETTADSSGNASPGGHSKALGDGGS